MFMTQGAMPNKLCPSNTLSTQYVATENKEDPGVYINMVFKGEGDMTPCSWSS